MTDGSTAGDDGRKLLWGSYMLSSVLCLRSVPVQVSGSEQSPTLAQGALTGPQHGYTNCLRRHAASQLDNLMANAHAMGYEEARGPHFGLHEHYLPRKAVLWLCRRPKGQFRAWAFPLLSRLPASRRQIISRWPCCATKWLLGTEGSDLVGLRGHHVFHSRNVLSGLGPILCAYRCHALRPARAYTPGRPRAHLGRVLS